jgi:predicted regulator of Ras-like GTPase activity (Roadblock/LC7/MglB family)
MNQDLRAIAEQALADLREVSPQIQAAVLLTRDGSTLAASLDGSDQEELGRLATRIVDAAEQARTELGREPVTQCEIATGTGHVFVVTDARHIVLAVTPTDPTVGLVFYDLKTTLRTLRESGASSDATSNGSAPKGDREEAEA